MSLDHSITDFITGKAVKNAGSEASRQLFEKFLVQKKGYAKEDIRVDEKIIVQFKNENYESTIDLIVCCQEKPIMAITCVAGSIGSYEREILAGARLVYDLQIPIAISTDSRDAIIMDTLTGKKMAQGLENIPSKEQIISLVKSLEFKPYDEDRKKREMIIFRSFNLEKVNI